MVKQPPQILASEEKATNTSLRFEEEKKVLLVYRLVSVLILS